MKDGKRLISLGETDYQMLQTFFLIKGISPIDEWVRLIPRGRLRRLGGQAEQQA